MSLLDTASLIVTPNGYNEGKLYSVIPSDGSGDLSVTRATTATRVNSAGLVELLPYNLLQYSEQFNNAAWIKSGVTVTANSATAPNGTLTADTITDTSTFGIIYQNYTNLNISQIVTFSVYLKKTNNDWVAVATARSGTTTYGEFGAWFNLATGVIGSNYTPGAGVLIDKEIESVGNGWYRCSVTGYVPNSTDYLSFSFNANADNSLTSSVGQSHYQWGAQLVEGSVAKDYQKTETRLNIPRLDYSNGTCPSILVEPQRTNLITYSSSFDNSDWLKTNLATITANQTTAPDGTLTADRLNTASSGSYIFSVQTAFSLSNNTYSHSVYAKAGTQSVFTLGFGTPIGQWFATFNLTTASVTATGGSTATGTIEDAGNGWYRCILTATLPVLTYCENQIGFTSASGNMFIWGAQVELGSYATSYIPTTSASVTRNADVISKTGISSLIGQTEGTIFGEMYTNPIGTESMLAWIRNSTAGIYNNFIFTGTNPIGQARVQIVDSGVVQAEILSVNPLSIGWHKFAVAYKQNDFVFYVDGVQVGSDTSGSVPSGMNELFLDQYIDGGIRNASKKSFALWKTRLTNTQLAQLTTI